MGFGKASIAIVMKFDLVNRMVHDIAARKIQLYSWRLIEVLFVWKGNGRG